MRHEFPLPFESLRSIRGGKQRSYVIGAMFTAAYAHKAERLAASCERFELPYVIHEVPAVHSSISHRGTDDLAYTKETSFATCSPNTESPSSTWMPIASSYRGPI